MSRILVVDDELLFQQLLCKLLKTRDHDVVAAADGEEALQMLHESTFDLMISDISMQPVDGMELLRTVRELYSSMGVIMLTGHGSIETAVESMKYGAFDYITKPFKIQELTQTIRHALEYQLLQPENSKSQTQLAYRNHAEKLKGIITENPGMILVCNKIERIAPSDTTVLIYGEKGSGKNLVARDLHRYSPRNALPFTTVNCESLLSGKVSDDPFVPDRGGTLFLDKINTLSLDLQNQLLEVLNQRKATPTDAAGRLLSDGRFIAAADERLEPLVEQGRFDSNLYKYLSAITIDIPPLRNRPEDILPLVGQTMHKKLSEDTRMPKLDNEAELILDHYNWPGNVRELEETILHALASTKNDVITKASLPENIVTTVENDLRSGLIVGRYEKLIGKSLKTFLHDKKMELLERIHRNNEIHESSLRDGPQTSSTRSDNKDVWCTFERQ
jgi:DNA-binding NtrC family response regulator